MSMCRTRLIFVEGMPGSGKSTITSLVATGLQERGHAAKMYQERQPSHPLNVGGDQHPSGRSTGETLYRAYSPAAFIEESLERWDDFVGMVLCGEAIAVLDSYPFQNSVRVLLQLNASFECISEYVRQVEALAAPLNPVLVYLGSNNPAEAFADTCEKRGVEWTDYVTRLVAGCPYAEARGLKGTSGVSEFLEDYRMLSDSLLEQMSIPKLVIKDCRNHWDECHRQIREFLVRHLAQVES